MFSYIDIFILLNILYVKHYIHFINGYSLETELSSDKLSSGDNSQCLAPPSAVIR